MKNPATARALPTAAAVLPTGALILAAAQQTEEEK